MIVFKWTIKILSLVFFIVITLGLFGWIQYNEMRPDYPESISLEALDAPVSIVVDSAGIAHIKAANEKDLVIAMGYQAALERLWQMDLLRYAGQGKLSAVFGESTLAFDRMFRTLGLDSMAAKLHRNADEPTREWLQWYCQGINAYITQISGQVPLDYQMLNIRPETWEAQHLWVIQRLIAWMLNDGWRKNVLRYELKQQLDPLLFRELYPQLPRQRAPLKPLTPSTAAIAGELWHVDQAFRQWLGIVARPREGIAMAVAPQASRRSAAGLLNNEILSSQLPFGWLEVRLSSPEIDAAGFAIPGIPGIWAGRNADIAWGVVAGDGTEALRLQSFPVRFQNQEYYAGNAEQSLPFLKEIIAAGRRFYSHVIFRNEDALIIRSPEEESDSEWLQLEWSGYQLSNEFAALRKMLRAGDRKAFDKALNTFGVPGSQWAVATHDGQIAVKTASAKLPPIVPDAAVPSMKKLRRSAVNKPPGRAAAAQQPLLWHIAVNGRLADILSQKTYRGELPDSLKMDLTMTAPGAPFTTLRKHSEDLLKEWLGLIDPARLELDRDRLRNLLWMLYRWQPGEAESPHAAAFFQVWQWCVFENLFRPVMGDDLFNRFCLLPDEHLRLFYAILRNPQSAWFKQAQRTPLQQRAELLMRGFRESLGFFENALGDELYAWEWNNVFSNDYSPRHSGQLDAFLFQHAADKKSGGGKGLNRVFQALAGKEQWLGVDWATDGADILYRSRRSEQVSEGPVSRFYRQRHPSAVGGRKKTLYGGDLPSGLITIHLQPAVLSALE